jgi:hypothetical protein
MHGSIFYQFYRKDYFQKPTRLFTKCQITKNQIQPIPKNSNKKFLKLYIKQTKLALTHQKMAKQQPIFEPNEALTKGGKANEWFPARFFPR